MCLQVNFLFHFWYVRVGLCGHRPLDPSARLDEWWWCNQCKFNGTERMFTAKTLQALNWLVFRPDISRSLNLYSSFQMAFYNSPKLADQLHICLKDHENYSRILQFLAGDGLSKLFPVSIFGEFPQILYVQIWSAWGNTTFLQTHLEVVALGGLLAPTDAFTALGPGLGSLLKLVSHCIALQSG